MDAAVLRQKIRYAAGSATAETIGDRAEGQAAVRMLWGNAAGILLDAARHFAERTAVLEAHEVRTTSFAELWGGALALARRLQCAGIRPGDRVAILLERGAASAAAYFGTLACGGAAVIVNETLKTRQIDYILRHSEAGFVVCAGELLGRLPQALSAEIGRASCRDRVCQYV